MLSSKSAAFRSYSQLALIVIAAGAIYPLLYLRQNFEISILESFNITQTQLRYCSSMLGLIFVITYIPSGWLADRFSSRKLLAYSLLATALLGVWFSTMPSYSSLLVIYGAWGVATGLTFWSAHIKLVAMLAKKDQQGKFFGILDGGRGLVEALLATVAIALFAYVLSQDSGSTTIALKQVIYLYIGVLLLVAPLVYWLLDDFEETDEKFCAECGTVIKNKSEICPKCGVRQIAQPSTLNLGAVALNGKNRIAAALFAFMLGAVGGHKFYLGKVGMGFVYLIFFWTFIPAIIAFVELILFLTMSDEEFTQKHGQVSNSVFMDDLMTVLKHREIWLCAICIVCGYQLFYATYSFAAYLQQNFGLTAVAVGTITVAKLWMRPIGGIAAGFIGDWSSPEKVLSILLVLASISLSMMAFLPTTSASIVMLVVVLLIGLLTYGVRGLYWATLGGCNVPNKIKGLAIGMISMIGYFPEMYLPLISAPLLEQYPGGLGYRIYYLIISACGLLGAYAAYLLGRPKPPVKSTGVN